MTADSDPVLRATPTPEPVATIPIPDVPLWQLLLGLLTLMLIVAYTAGWFR